MRNMFFLLFGKWDILIYSCMFKPGCLLISQRLIGQVNGIYPYCSTPNPWTRLSCFLFWGPNQPVSTREHRWTQMNLPWPLSKGILQWILFFSLLPDGFGRISHFPKRPNMDKPQMMLQHTRSFQVYFWSSPTRCRRSYVLSAEVGCRPASG